MFYGRILFVPKGERRAKAPGAFFPGRAAIVVNVKLPGTTVVFFAIQGYYYKQDEKKLFSLCPDRRCGH
jgi:hypothetical protein